jgi:DNA polymerase phi
MIFQKMIEGGSSSPFILEAVFSKNLMACLMNQASREDRYLHRAAVKALKSIETTVQNEPSVLEPVLRQLLGEHGAYNFDQRTNTKVVEKLLQSTTSANANAILEVIKTTNNLEPPLSLQTYGNYLFRLASLPTGAEKVGDEDGVPVPVLALQELARITYSKSDDAAAPDEKARDTLRNRVTSAFAKFVRRPEDFAHLCNAVLLIEADLGMDEEIESELVRALERLKELLDCEDVSANLRAPYHGLALLHAVGILQLYNEDPDALETLADLEQCYDKLKGKALEGEGGISEFLVEILLSMVAQPSSLMRQVSQQVFEAFTPVLSGQAIQLLTDPLSANENEKGQQALFSTEDEDMNGAADDDESDDSDQESLDSDVEIVDLEDAPSDQDSDSSDSDEAESVQGDAGKDELEALDDALAKVLKSHRLDKDAEAESSDDSDMSDSEMMELDEKLVEIFKQRAKTSSNKKGKRDAKESVINFKHRVLDLLGIFVKKEAASSNPLAFQVLLPLLELVRTTTVKPLANKACEIVLTFTKGLKKSRGSQDSPADELDADTLMQLLHNIHAEASKDLSHVFARAASAASLAVASVLCASTDRTEEVFQLYAQTQLKWYRGEVKMQPSFFTDWLNWCQGHASNTAAQGKE